MTEAAELNAAAAQAETLALCQNLIKRQSVTPKDGGCQSYISERLSRCGFQCEAVDVGKVQNLWAVTGTDGPLMVLAGHTDVVPPGPAADWDSPPFSPTIRGDFLYGRGACDMKGAVAAMVTAAERLQASGFKPNGRLGLLLTSDEEGPAVDGTQAVLRWLQERGEQIDWCLIGEPSSKKTLGDRIRVGRRGSINGFLKVRGTQGHVAYPDQAENPIPAALQLLNELNSLSWDQGNEYFPATRLQITNIHSGAQATNVVPGELEAWFNLRFNTEQTADTIKTRIEAVCAESKLRHGLSLELRWELSGDPFLTKGDTLIAAVTQATEASLGVTPAPSTDGGTSDGRFIAKTGAEIVELGLVGDTIHQVNECCLVYDLGRLSQLYESVIVRLLGTGGTT